MYLIGVFVVAVEVAGVTVNGFHLLAGAASRASSRPKS